VEAVGADQEQRAIGAVLRDGIELVRIAGPEGQVVQVALEVDG
jgi:hypothetical protein